MTSRLNLFIIQCCEATGYTSRDILPAVEYKNPGEQQPLIFGGWTPFFEERGPLLSMPFIQGGDFTHKSQEAIMKAQSIARDFGHQQIDALHLLLALLSQEESIVLTLLQKLQLDVEDLKRKTESQIKQIPPLAGQETLGQFYFTQDMAQVLDKARAEAMKMGDEFISIEHLFLGVLATKTGARDVLEKARSLTNQPKALDSERILKLLADIRGEEKITDPDPESKYEVLEKYARNLTALARIIGLAN